MSSFSFTAQSVISTGAIFEADMKLFIIPLGRTIEFSVPYWKKIFINQWEYWLNGKKSAITILFSRCLSKIRQLMLFILCFQGIL